MDKVLFCTAGLFLKPKADLTKNTLFFFIVSGDGDFLRCLSSKGFEVKAEGNFMKSLHFSQK